MNSIPSEKERELCARLNTGNTLIEDCVQCRISFDNFLATYGNFYMQYGLDGHESDDAEKALLHKHAPEIAFHKAVWDEVISKVTADEYMNRPETIEAGFIGHPEAFTRLIKLVEKYR